MVSNMLRKPVVKVRGKPTVARQTDTHASRQPREEHTKPFAKVSFYLDLKDYPGLKTLTNEIKNLGGTVETFLSKDVKYVVTNRLNWKQQLKNGALEDGSLPSTPNSLSNTKSGVTNDSPHNLESPKERGVPKAVTSRASAMLEKARKSATKGSSDVLQIARLWGVKVVSVTAFVCMIKRSKFQQTHQRPHSGKDISKLKLKSSTALKTTLKNPFVKFEDSNREFRPQYLQFREWPVLDLNTRHSRSPFVRASSKKLIQRNGALRQKREPSSIPNQGKSLQYNLRTSKKESSKQIKNVLSMVTQPLNSSTCAENNKNDVVTKPGFCEMCLIRYEDIYAHIKDKEHQKHVTKPGFYAALDKKIATLPDILTFAKKVFQSRMTASRSRSSDLIAIENKINTKENFSVPLPKLVRRKRKQHADTSQPLGKKRKAHNTENCSSDTKLKVLEQCSESPTKVRKSKTNENVDISKDSVAVIQTNNSKGLIPCKRKALQPLDLNAVKFANTQPRQSQGAQKFSPDNQVHSGEKTDCDEKPEAIRVLRSTAMRRISACQSAASSPSFRSSVRGDLHDPRKANSSPSISTFAKKTTTLFGVCRSLDLGISSSGSKRQSFLEATQKLKNLALECQDDMPCLEAVLDAFNNELLDDMPSLTCVTPISPFKPDSSPRPTQETPRDNESALKIEPQTTDCNSNSQKPIANPCTVMISADSDAVECSDTSAQRNNIELRSGLFTTNEADDNKAVPVLIDKVSEPQEKTECATRCGLVTDCVQDNKVLGVDMSDEPIRAITEEVTGFTIADSPTKDAFESPGKSQNQAVQSSPKVMGSEDDSDGPLVHHSSSSEFNLISSPIFEQNSKTGTSTDSAVGRSEGIPKIVFKRIRSDKRTQWTLRILRDSSGVA